MVQTNMQLVSQKYMYNCICMTNLQGLELLLVVLEEVVPLLTDLGWVQVVARAHPTLEENRGHAMTTYRDLDVEEPGRHVYCW